MGISDSNQSEPSSLSESRSHVLFMDLALFLAVMFLIREVHFSSFGFVANGLFWSLSTLVVATWRMKVRGVSWANLGLRKPKQLKTVVVATSVIIGMAIGSIIIFQMLTDQFSWNLAPDTSNEDAASKFGELKNNWGWFFSIIPFIWLESFLEEVLDRGFLMNWIERMFSATLLATVLAVGLQAVIFGFRHSNDFSERSITVGLIGLAMGVGYLVFGRNLWPPILAHCALNTISMIDRVG